MLDLLEELKIPCVRIEHPAVFTIEEMKALDFPEGTCVAKNLFLRDAKGKRHFLVVTTADRRINLKELEGKLYASKLSFASEKRLQKHLGLTQGAVSPLGLINDEDQAVEFWLDQALQGCEKIGIHPNDNTATVLLSGKDLIRFVESRGHEVNLIRL